MNAVFNRSLSGLAVFFFGMTVLSCASIPKLRVEYRLPPKPEGFHGEKVYLEILDERADKGIIREGAKEDFENFPGNVSLSVARPHDTGFMIGLYGPVELVEEGFARRLKDAGLKVASSRSQSELALQLVLKNLSLDLANRRWVAEMAYEARLRKSGRVLSSQSVSGRVERYKLYGRGQADKAMGEVFTDTVNRLDVLELFKKAGLMGDDSGS